MTELEFWWELERLLAPELWQDPLVRALVLRWRDRFNHYDEPPPRPVDVVANIIRALSAARRDVVDLAVRRMERSHVFLPPQAVIDQFLNEQGVSK